MPVYKFSKIPTSAFNIIMAGINDSGQVIGSTDDGQGRNHYGFTYRDGQTTSIFRDPTGINDSGTIVIDTNYDGLIYKDGIYSQLNYPGHSVHPSGISSSGVIVGTTRMGFGSPEGFVLADGVYAPLSVASYETHPTGVNALGQITGFYLLPSQDPYRGAEAKPFLYQNGQYYTSTEVPGAYQTSPNGINDAGQIAGAYRTAQNGENHGFVASGGIISSIDFPGSRSTSIDGISKSGQIVGTYLVPESEGYRFKGFTAVKTSLRNDLNGDAKADLVFQNGDGTVGVWSMNDTAIISAEPITGAYAPPGWMVKGAGDLNGDLKADLLLQNAATGALAVWAMDGSSVLATAALPVAPGPDWALLGSGDLNGDGKGDLVFQNSASRVVAVWLMDGATTAEAAPITTAYAPPGWAVKAIGDLNGDAMDDLVLQNADGAVAIWALSGTEVLATAVPTAPGAEWRLVGAGDLNGDAKSDLVFQSNITNTVVGWLMNGATILEASFIGNIATPPEPNLQGVEDLNGDGKDDLVFHSSDGSVAVWLMDGLAAAAVAVLGMNSGPGWCLAGGQPGGMTSGIGCENGYRNEYPAFNPNVGAALEPEPAYRRDSATNDLASGLEN